MFNFGIRVAFPMFSGWRVYLRGHREPLDVVERDGMWTVSGGDTAAYLAAYRKTRRAAEVV
jgi:hypothetical protein